MQQTAARKLFVNLPVRDLKKSMEFFSRLEFTFNPKFTDENAACMLVGEGAYVMLLAQPFYKTFTNREICDTTRYSEGLFALTCQSRDEVDRFVATALTGGGTKAMPPKDHGFMYVSSFYDLDGHHWEVFWMDPAAVQ